ncbi:MAG TPA: hypothetical protein VNO30_13530 [Kofleriaceae bacterium]|nr:hypothetical protein [Kofleriaceae bacterium]
MLAWLAWAAAPAQAESARARHVRIASERGPIHVWAPARYDASTAGIVVYVHGYYIGVDVAWKHHRLARQFADSGQNALFIACEAPRGPSEPIAWGSLAELLATVAEKLDELLPEGPVVAIGHSGAHRTLSAWLDADGADSGGPDVIVLLDAMYGGMRQLREWLDAAPGRRLLDAAALTRRQSEALYADLSEVLVLDGFPSPRTRALPGARDARVVYVRSQFGHMQLVTSGVAIPMLLRAIQMRSGGPPATDQDRSNDRSVSAPQGTSNHRRDRRPAIPARRPRAWFVHGAGRRAGLRARRAAGRSRTLP